MYSFPILSYFVSVVQQYSKLNGDYMGFKNESLVFQTRFSLFINTGRA